MPPKLTGRFRTTAKATRQERPKVLYGILNQGELVGAPSRLGEDGQRERSNENWPAHPFVILVAGCTLVSRQT